VLADAGYQRFQHPDRRRGVNTAAGPAEEPDPGLPTVAAAHEAERRAHASQRIRAEHGISHLKNWRALSRHLGRGGHLDTMLQPSPNSSPAVNEPYDPISLTARPDLPRRHRRMIELALNK